MAQSAAVDGLKERFIVRICDSRFATLTDRLGQANNVGTVAYWTSTFTCMESADTDPELIRNVLGLGYNPLASYSLLVIDTLGIEEIADIRSMVPTWDNLGALGKSDQAAWIAPDDIDKAFRPEMAGDYQRVLDAAKKAKIDLNDKQERLELAEDVLGSKDAAKLFNARHTMAMEYGANEHFLGNGVTKSLAGGNNKLGALETLSYEKHPAVTQGLLEEHGKLAKLPNLTPLPTRPKIF